MGRFFFCVFCGGKLIQAIPPTWGTATECYVWSLSVRAWERKRVECNTPGTQMGIRTWRSAIADLKPTPPGAPATSRITTISTMVKTLMAVKSMMAVQVTAMAISTVPTAPANDASYIFVRLSRWCFGVLMLLFTPLLFGYIKHDLNKYS